MQLFAAIDFETATSERTSACAIGYVIFNKTKIILQHSVSGAWCEPKQFNDVRDAPHRNPK